MSSLTSYVTRPEFLWLLLGLPLLLLALWHSQARMTPMQRAVCTGLRIVILALLLLALAGLRFPWQSKDVAVVFALDRSASITPEGEAAARAYIEKALEQKRSGDEAIVVGFAEGVAPLTLPGKEAWLLQPNRDATDIGRALGFSAAIFPEGKTKRLLLLSDGFDTGGTASPAAQALHASGVELMTVPIANPFRPEVMAERLEIPAELREGEPFDATAIVRSNTEGRCHVKLYANGFLAGEETIQLKPGNNPVVFRNQRPQKESALYEVEIIPERDTVAENNRARATHLGRGEPRVLIVDAAPERLAPLQRALEAGHIKVEIREAGGLPTTMEELQRYDAFILSDISALQLSRNQMRLYQRWVKDFGGGFAMIGGENSFGVGGYYRTPLEAILPVETEHDDRTEFPTVAVMIILDSSGSMTAQVAGQTKMSLANQGAALALGVLQPKDLLGVTAVDTKVHPVAALARHANKADVSQQILRVTAGGGGIYVYTSLLDAYAQLREVNAKIKHIILFSDAADAEEKKSGEMADGSKVPGTAIDLVASMAASKITTSVVALGNSGDKDVTFLRQLAENGNGRFYLTSDALSLPQIFTSETMRVAQSSLVEEPAAAILARRTPVVEGIEWNEAPLLLGYNLTKLKPTADLLLATERGDPLLAVWRFGLGRTAAFTSDAKARWASEWLAWPGYGKFWTQLVRSLLPRSGSGGPGDLQVESFVEGNRLRVQIDAVDPEGAFRNRLPIAVGAVRPDGSRESVEAKQIAPGRYSASVVLSGTGTTWVNLSSPALPEGGRTLTHTASFPLEFLNNGTDAAALEALAKLSGGVSNPSPSAAFAPPAQGVRRHADLSPWLLGLALLLFPLDIWLRRRSW